MRLCAAGLKASLSVDGIPPQDIYSTPTDRSAATCGSRIIWYLLPVEMLGSEMDVCSWFPLASLF